jgi:hypothetical protein
MPAPQVGRCRGSDGWDCPPRRAAGQLLVDAIHRIHKGDCDLVAAVNESGSFPSPSASITQRAVAPMLAPGDGGHVVNPHRCAINSPASLCMQLQIRPSVLRWRDNHAYEQAKAGVLPPHR